MIRNIAALLSGNAASQFVNVITIAFVVTAYYSPSDFGRYAVCMSYVGILASVATLRYELGVVSSRGKIAANNLLVASLLILLAFVLATFAVVALLLILLGDAFLFGAPPVALLLLIALRSTDQVLASVLFREEAYFRYSALKLMQAIVLLAGFLAAGVRQLGLSGLLVSTILAYVAFAAGAAASIRRYDMLRGVRTDRMWVLLRRQVDFVKYNAPQVVLDNLLGNGLNFVLVVLAGPTVVGYFSYLSRILKAPLGLVFGAVSQVVFRFAAKNSREVGVVAREIRRVYVIVLAVLAAAVLGVGLVYVAFDSITMLKDWAGLRQHLLAFAAWMLIPFLFSPFATLPVVYRRQKPFFIAAATFNSLSLLAFAVLISIANVNAAFWTVALLSVPYYLGLNLWLSRVIRHV